MTSHPRLRVRGTPGYKSKHDKRSGEVRRALVYVPDLEHRKWIESELASLGVTVQISRTVAELVAALVDDPPPRPQLLFADFAAMDAGELLYVHAIREQGWFGSAIAIGRASLALRHSLKIERLIAPLSGPSVVRAAIMNITPAAVTIRVPRISG